MCKFSGKILMLAVAALFLNAGVALADPPSTDWNNSWGFPSPAEKANLLNQALAIELIEDGGFNVHNNNFFGGNTLAIGNQVNIDIDGDFNDVNDNTLDNDGNVSAQVNNGPGSIEQDIED